MLANPDLPIPLRTEPAVRLAYRTDAGQIVEGVPDAVVHASAPETVAALLQWAQRERVPVTCRGGGLTTEGESVTRRGVLLDLKGMNGVLECDGGMTLLRRPTVDCSRLPTCPRLPGTSSTRGTRRSIRST